MWGSWEVRIGDDVNGCITLQDAQTAQTKRQAGHKRKLAEMDQQATGIIAETEAKVKRMCKKAGRMSSLAKILQPFTQARSSPLI